MGWCKIFTASFVWRLTGSVDELGGNLEPDRFYFRRYSRCALFASIIVDGLLSGGCEGVEP